MFTEQTSKNTNTAYYKHSHANTKPSTKKHVFFILFLTISQYSIFIAVNLSFLCFHVKTRLGLFETIVLVAVILIPNFEK